MKCNNEYLIGVYKEIGKKPTLLKVLNTKEALEELVGGEFSIYNYKDYAVIYKKDSKNLLANVYFDEYAKIGTSLRGTIFAITYDNSSTFKSLNREQALNCINFFIKEAINYNIFDKNGKYIPKKKKNLSFNYEKERNYYNNSSVKSNDSNRQYMTNETSHIIKLSDNEILNMIYKISLILVNTIMKLTDENKK